MSNGVDFKKMALDNRDQLNAALVRESSLREELERVRSRYDREVLGLNNEGDPIGSDPAGGYKNDLARANSAFDELAACVGFSAARLDQTGDSPIDCANQLQQRLTVAEQRAALLTKALNDIRENSDDPGAKDCAIEAIAAANDPACKCPLTTDRHLHTKCQTCGQSNKSSMSTDPVDDEWEK